MLPKNTTLTTKDLPDEVVDGLFNAIDDYLSDKYGFCVNDYNIELKLEVNNIDWDTEE